MNKTTLKTIAAAALSLLTVACAKEQLADKAQQAGVSFTVEVPGAPATKAIGDGTTAKTLYYQVFDEDKNPIEGLGVQKTNLTETNGKMTAKVNFQLVKDQTYNFIFWAQTSSSYYYLIDAQEGLKKITANYPSYRSANDEKYDAFFAVKTIKITGPVSEPVTLKRPFAQINIASNDKVKAGSTVQDIDFTDAKSTFAVKNVPTVFAPLADKDNQLSEYKTEYVTFMKGNIPGGKLKVGENDYDYLSMNYVFAPEGGAVCDIEATVTVGGKDVKITVPNAPIKRNWRTNIIGKVLTTDADYDVVIDPTFDGDDTPKGGYQDGGVTTSLPTGPDMTGTVVNVNAENAQYTLDGAYGSINGKTINFTENIAETLVFGRPTKFSGSNTKYMVGGYDSGAENYQEFATSDELVAYKSQTQWTPGCFYIRTIENVKFTANDGIEIEGIYASSGHVYANDKTSPVYDYVLDNGTKLTEGSCYYSAYNFKNISFDGVTFRKNAKFTKNSNGEGPSTIDGLTFTGCHFLTYDTVSSAKARIYFQNNATVFENAFKNIVVDGCDFDTSYQGVYTQYVYGLTVRNSTFTTTGHNAIGIQHYSTVVPDYGKIVIEKNTFDKIGDRVIRFGNMGADTQIAIFGNKSTNSGDKNGEVMKAESLADGITYNIHDNSWNADAGIVVNEELVDWNKKVQTPGATVVLSEGTHTLPSKIAEGVTIEGVEGTVINMLNEANKPISIAGCNKVTFKNLEMNMGTQDPDKGFIHSDNLVFEDCSFTGKVVSYGTHETYRRCTFNNSNYALQLYGSKHVNIEDCTFSKYSRAILIYSSGSNEFDVKVSNCKFPGSYSLKAAIEIHTEVGAYGSLVIDNCTIGSGKLWKEVNNYTGDSTTKFTVTVDGETVQTAK